MKKTRSNQERTSLVPLIILFGLLYTISACGGGGGATNNPPPPSNNPPIAANDIATTRMNVSVDISVLSNDVDPDGNTLTITDVTQGSNGLTAINANGTVRYIPNTDYSGQDRFTYTVSDSQGGTTNAEVTVNIAFTKGLPIERVSTASDGTQGNQDSWMGAISPDGRHVAFYSSASNLITGDNGSNFIFIRDRLTNQTTRVSVASDGTKANGSSQQPAISSGGRYAAFCSFATNLVAGDNNGKSDIFVHDRNTGMTTRVSVASNGTEANDYNYAPSISADGRYIAFYSVASNLVSGDANGGGGDIFVHDMNTGETILVSLDSNGAQIGGGAFYEGPAISGDGRYVAFESGGNIYVRDRQTNITIIASVASDGTVANDASDQHVISSDGHYVAFTSVATNLVANDTNGVRDVFVHNLQTGETIRVSVATGGTEGNGAVPFYDRPAISADGRYISFISAATNLVLNDTNGLMDVFVHDRVANQTSRVSVASDGTEANGVSGDSVLVSITDNGEYIAFASAATNLIPGDTNGWMDVFAAPNPLAP